MRTRNSCVASQSNMQAYLQIRGKIITLGFKKKPFPNLPLTV